MFDQTCSQSATGQAVNVRTSGAASSSIAAASGKRSLSCSTTRACWALLAPADSDAEARADACAEGWSEGRIEAALIHLSLRLEAGWWRLLAGHAVCLLCPTAVGRCAQTAGTVFGLGAAGEQLGSAFADIRVDVRAHRPQGVTGFVDTP